MTGVEIFPVPIYGGRVFLCLKREAYAQALTGLNAAEDRHLSACNGVTSFHVDKDGHQVYLLGIFEKVDKTLIHELAHTAFAILAHAQVRISHRNDEAFAYLIETLFAECQTALKRLRRRK